MRYLKYLLLLPFGFVLSLSFFGGVSAHAASADPVCNLLGGLHELPATIDSCAKSGSAGLSVGGARGALVVKDFKFSTVSDEEGLYSYRATVDPKPEKRSYQLGSLPLCSNGDAYVKGSSGAFVKFSALLDSWPTGNRDLSSSFSYSNCFGQSGYTDKYALIYAAVWDEVVVDPSGFKPGIGYSSGGRCMAEFCLKSLKSVIQGSNVVLTVTYDNACHGTLSSTAYTNCRNTAWTNWCLQAKCPAGSPTTGFSGGPPVLAVSSSPSSVGGSFSSSTLANGVDPSGNSCRTGSSGTYTYASVCTFSYTFPTANLYFSLTRAYPVTYDSMTPQTLSFGAWLSPSNPGYSEGSVSKGPVTLKYTLLSSDALDDLSVIPDSPDLDDSVLEDNGLCTTYECVSTMCDDEGGFLNIGKLWCFIVPPNFSFSGVFSTFSDAFTDSSIIGAGKSFFSDLTEFGRTFAHGSDNYRSCLMRLPGGGYFSDAEINFCTFFSDENESFESVIRTILGVLILLGAILLSLSVDFRIITGSFNPLAGFFGKGDTDAD